MTFGPLFVLALVFCAFAAFDWRRLPFCARASLAAATVFAIAGFSVPGRRPGRGRREPPRRARLHGRVRARARVRGRAGQHDVPRARRHRALSARRLAQKRLPECRFRVRPLGGRRNTRERRMDSATAAHRAGITRFAALAAVIAAAVLVALLLFGGGDSYTLKARFINAGQLVKGNLVELGGVQIGQVTGFEVTDNGEAEVEFEVEEDYAPLPAGSRLLIRPGSLSSVANRFIEVHLPSAERRPTPTAGEQEMLDDGAVIHVGPHDVRGRDRHVLQHVRQEDARVDPGLLPRRPAPVRGRRRRREPRPPLPQDEPLRRRAASSASSPTTRPCSSGSSRTPRASSPRSPRRRASSARSSTT